MQLNIIVTKLERLLTELSELPCASAMERRAPVSDDAEFVADRWVRKYVRNRRLPAPHRTEVIRVLKARAAYAIAFANLLPRPELDLSPGSSVQMVETLMIDLWHQCFRHKWMGNDVKETELAFAE